MDVLGILGQSALIVAVTAFSLGVTALTRNLRNKLVLSYAALCGVIAAWAFFFFLEKVFGSGTFYRFHLAFNLMLAPVGLLFLGVLTRVDSLFHRWLYRGSIVYAIAVAALAWTDLGRSPVIQNLANFGPSFLALGCVNMMLIRLSIRRGRRGLTVSALRSFTTGFSGKIWIYLGGIALLFTAVMDHVPRMGEVIPCIGNVLLCAYLFIVSEVVIHQRLLNVSALLNRLLILTFISACFTLIYTLLVAWIDHSPGLFILNSFLASFIILMLIEPAKRLVNWSVVRFFSVKYLLFEEKAKSAERALTGVLDAAGLAQVTLQFLESALRCESATVFVLRSDGTKFRRIRGLRDDELANREILANHPLIEFFLSMKKRGETPIALDHYIDTERERSTSGSRRMLYDSVLKGLEGLNANIALPFLFGGGAESTVLGFAALKASQPPEPWSDNWGALPVMYPFFENAARVLKNMDVYVRLREKDRLAALGEMAAGLAHEIRNPLGAIKGAAQYLEPQSAGSQTAFLKVIVEEVNRLNKVVTRFLDYSRPIGADFVESRVGPLLDKTVAVFRSAGGALDGLQLELAAPAEGLERLPSVRCAPEQIQQVLVNLVQNAIQAILKAPPAEGGRVRVGARLVRTDAFGSDSLPRTNGAEIAIFVEDNGPGIPRENLEKIFIPFFTTSVGGTGLGLPICSRIVESHGGRIEVQSATESGTEGRTTRFTVYLPVRRSGE